MYASCMQKLRGFAAEAAQYADQTAEEWQETKETWADRYREQGIEGGVDELAGR
ncbi:hypothetical protein [Natrinema saccharevitans]|uniref:hypothetical protein n=1 Tax=Natrinema saccharevitans TaxID=301967 RepID=UPI0015886DAF|nr:hypothetical protein [Natrinema saccharevitans]